MQAIRQTTYTGIEALQLTTIKAPTLTPISAIVRNHYTPVLPYDWLTETGQLRHLRPVHLPITIGYGFAGIVEEVGVLRDKQLLGQRVIGATPTGAGAELVHAIIPPLLFPVPETVSLKDAATVIGGADAAYAAIQKIGVTPQDTILVTGASGGVGVYLIQLLKLAGATVIALSRPANTALLTQLGADHVVNYAQSLTEQLRNLPPVTKLIDTVGSTTLLNQITASQAALTIVSLAQQQYVPLKPSQRFAFVHESIGLNDYRMLLTLLAEQKIVSVIQQTFNYQDVVNAQLTAKNHHTQGRVLLRYN